MSAPDISREHALRILARPKPATLKMMAREYAAIFEPETNWPEADD